ncbi:MAG: hypothetical protein HY433_02860, partial [Candidatus Liptonbacteria bacterium]|nr:hypothetical protein [Candidatus Liptonbacteria bacterium]
VSRSQVKVERVMAWGLVGIGAYLFQYLPFKMAFWEGSIFHVMWNDIVMRTLPSIAESEKIEELLNIQGGTATILPWIFIGLMVGAVIIWDAFVQRKKLTPHTIASSELRGRQNQVIQ